ncbi:exported protein of unknown function [Nitrospira moscoviensis]|uniref:Uncharacterized protein n=2 Tax=Nitrospira moscoviensis TaxID=42253 RepID=A0A0K2GFC8_NITMO|nr:exported protein of unknown function [Nitrospira moscoviensis]
MTHRRRTRLHIAIGVGLLVLMFFMPWQTLAEMKAPESQQGSGDMRSMKKMMGECREHHDKASKAIDQMMIRMEEGQRSNDATKMRATLEASQNGLADLKQDMATCMNMMSMMDKMDSGMGGHMDEMGGMREGMEGMMERKSR